MKNLRLLYSAVFLLSLTTLFSCQKPPEFPVVPHIEFLRVERQRTIEDGAIIDVLSPIIRFEDGDGDLGLTPEDLKTSPYNQGNNNINYVIDVFIKRKNSTTYEPLNLPFTFSGYFLPLSPDKRIGPLEGELKYNMIPLDERSIGDYISKGDVLKFRIKIKDRKLNVSNTVESDDILMLVP